MQKGYLHFSESMLLYNHNQARPTTMRELKEKIREALEAGHITPADAREILRLSEEG